MAICTLCGRRKAKRACPALGHPICSVCCATKRITEIACPADCAYLAAAQSHPPAVVQRQRTRDVTFLVNILGGLTEPQSRLSLFLFSVVSTHRAVAVPRLIDLDVAEAASALAQTLETASRGVIYEHQPVSLPAQRLLQALKEPVTTLTERAPRSIDRDVVTALRAVERGALEARTLDGSSTAFLDLIGRTAKAALETPDDEQPAPTPDPPRIVLP